MIKLSLNQNSCKKLSILEFIKVSKEFNGVELNFSKLKNFINEKKNLKELLEQMEIYDLKLTSIFALKNFSLCSDSEFNKKIIPKYKKIIEACYRLEANLIVLKPSEIDWSSETNLNQKSRIIKRTGRRLEDLGTLASQSDISLGLEISSHRISSIPTLIEAKELLKPLEYKENLGYVIDTFNLANTQVDINQLTEIRDFIFLIRLADSRTNDLKQDKRFFPGEGEYNFIQFFDFIQKLNYRKSYSINALENNCSARLYKKFYTIFKQ